MTALSLVLLFIFPLDAWAEEGGAAEGDEEPRNWELIVGGHVFREPEYEGSGELEFMVFPLIVASYEIAPFELFI
jgi:outer membrane scaffolding protein for murein synthesis (MipA/OmpV family)